MLKANTFWRHFEDFQGQIVLIIWQMYIINSTVTIYMQTLGYYEKIYTNSFIQQYTVCVVHTLYDTVYFTYYIHTSAIYAGWETACTYICNYVYNTLYIYVCMYSPHVDILAPLHKITVTHL
jgi:hypothetical protein